jgi:hypothetical protein
MAKHTLVVIGFMGRQIAYLDIPREEAERRYRAANDGGLDVVGVLEFDDEFECYDVPDAKWDPLVKHKG